MKRLVLFLGSILVAIVGVATGTAQAQTGTITGTVTRSSNGSAIVNIPVVVINPATMTGIGAPAFTNGAGQFTLTNVPAGSVYVRTAGGGAGNFIDEFYDNRPCPPCTNPTTVTVTAGGTTAGINFALAVGGGISGTVRDANTLVGIAGVSAQIYDAQGVFVDFFNSNASGAYTRGGLPAGVYYVRTSSTLNYVDQLWNSIPCTPCTVTQGTPIVVTAGTTQTNINFNLMPGGTVTGTVRNAALSPLAAVQVQAFAASGGNLIRSVGTNGSGVYTLSGLPTGSYFLRTAAASNHVDEIYDNVVAAGRLPTAGTPVSVTALATTANIDFTLATGLSITGAVSNEATLAPIAGVLIEVLTSTGVFVRSAVTSASGVYTVPNLPSGSYFVRTSNSLGFADELYNNIPHSRGSVLGGTPVPAGSVANFALATGGTISGTVSNAAPGGPVPDVGIEIVNAAGIEVRFAIPAPDGTYSVNGLPAGTYYARTRNDAGYIDVLYNGLPAPPLSSSTLGSAIAVTAGATTGSINFVVSAGGRIAGRLTQSGAGTPIPNANVMIFSSGGGIVGVGSTNGAGDYITDGGLAPGTYYAATIVHGYVGQVYSGLQMCAPVCHPVTAGTPIAVTAGNTTGSIDMALDTGVEMIQNGRFLNGFSNWTQFATPDMSYISAQVNANGNFSFARVPPPPGTSNQAVVFQNTGVAVPTGTNLVATFLVGNDAPVRKRISVLIHDSDFSDLSVCTFWLPPLGSDLIPYVVRTRTTKAWTNATIAYYAASPSSPAGMYLLDDVSMQMQAGPLVPRTDCVDMLVPPATGEPDGPELLGNGNFESPTLAPWGTFGNIQSQVVNGVFEFIKLPGLPAGVVLQATAQAIPVGRVITASFQLGNSSGVRKRVTALLHDNDFTDLSGCTFWLEPGQALSTYVYRAYTTKPWTNATLSIYPASASPDQWIRLDNVSLRTTPTALIAGTDCIEPGGEAWSPGTASSTGTGSGGSGRVGTPNSEWTALETTTSRMLQRAEPFDLTGARAAKLRVDSWLLGNAARGAVQVSTNGVDWITIHTVDPSDRWTPIEIDLRDFIGDKVLVRFVIDAGQGEGSVLWRLGAIAIDVSRK